jgi:hypothetical protein
LPDEVGAREVFIIKGKGLRLDDLRSEVRRLVEN